MCENFDLAAIFFAPKCPDAKNHGNKEITFDTTIDAIDGKKSGRGKMGVKLQYHKKHEFLALPEEQKYELVAYIATKDGGKWKGAFGKPWLADSKQNGKGNGYLSNNKF